MWHLSLLHLVKGTPVNFGYISLCGLSSSRGRCYALALGLCGMSHSSLLMVYECVCLHTLGIVRDSLTQVPGPDAGPRTEKLLSEGSLKCTAAAWGRWSHHHSLPGKAVFLFYACPCRHPGDVELVHVYARPRSPSPAWECELLRQASEALCDLKLPSVEAERVPLSLHVETILVIRSSRFPVEQ